MFPTFATVPVSADLFLGLVTHAHSRFADAVGPVGLVHSVAREVEKSGRTTEVAVSQLDEWTPELLALTWPEVRRSVDAELSSEARWRTYVAGSSLTARTRLTLAARRVMRRMRFAPPWRRTLAPEDPGPRMVRRLANIELSHVRIMRLAVDSGARWCLIVEDDAAVADVTRFSRELLAFIDGADERRQPLTINLSESFTPEQLGIEKLLLPLDMSSTSVPWRLFAASRPVTNTVCAVLYRADYLHVLSDELSRIPLSPVIPIDFKVNEAVMRLAPRMAAGDCWVASPAPLTQLSGVPNVGPG